MQRDAGGELDVEGPHARAAAPTPRARWRRLRAAGRRAIRRTASRARARARNSNARPSARRLSDRRRSMASTRATRSKYGRMSCSTGVAGGVAEPFAQAVAHRPSGGLVHGSIYESNSLSAIHPAPRPIPGFHGLRANPLAFDPAFERFLELGKRLRHFEPLELV